MSHFPKPYSLSRFKILKTLAMNPHAPHLPQGKEDALIYTNRGEKEENMGKNMN